jgi:hypothetical protein
MDAGVLITIAVCAVIVISLFTLLGRRRYERTRQALADQARAHREEARVRHARAARAEAEAEERLAIAERERRFASDRVRRAEGLEQTN